MAQSHWSDARSGSTLRSTTFLNHSPKNVDRAPSGSCFRGRQRRNDWLACDQGGWWFDLRANFGERKVRCGAAQRNSRLGFVALSSGESSEQRKGARAWEKMDRRKPSHGGRSGTEFKGVRIKRQMQPPRNARIGSR